MERIKEVFRMHGASAMASSDLGFVPADFPADAVSLLAPCGDLWGLRYDLRYPFASWLAHQAALLNIGKPIAYIKDMISPNICRCKGSDRRSFCVTNVHNTADKSRY